MWWLLGDLFGSGINQYDLNNPYYSLEEKAAQVREQGRSLGYGPEYYEKHAKMYEDIAQGKFGGEGPSIMDEASVVDDGIAE
ncbi:MAG: hypothetical protein ACR2Q4_09660 [Geminicoccaceae bacterium]